MRFELIPETPSTSTHDFSDLRYFLAIWTIAACHGSTSVCLTICLDHHQHLPVMV